MKVTDSYCAFYRACFYGMFYNNHLQIIEQNYPSYSKLIFNLQLHGKIGATNTFLVLLCPCWKYSMFWFMARK